MRTPRQSEKVVERKPDKNEGEIAIGFLQLANEAKSKADLVRASAMFFQEQSGCEAVGVRLKEGDDYPYFEARDSPRNLSIPRQTFVREISGAARSGTAQAVLLWNACAAA